MIFKLLVFTNFLNSIDRKTFFETFTKGHFPEMISGQFEISLKTSGWDRLNGSLNLNELICFFIFQSVSSEPLSTVARSFPDILTIASLVPALS